MPEFNLSTPLVPLADRPLARLAAFVSSDPDVLKALPVDDLLYRALDGTVGLTDGATANAIGMVLKRLDIQLDEIDSVQPELHWIGNNTRWLAGIDVYHGTRQGTHFVPLAAVNKNTNAVMDLWMVAFRGFIAATTTAATTASAVLTVDSTTNIEVGMLVEGAGIANPLPKVLSIDSATQVTLSAPVTVANAVALTFFDNPVFGIGLTPPELNTYRTQFAAPENEPTMGTVGLRIGAAQEAYAFGMYDSNNNHVWGGYATNSDVYFDFTKFRALPSGTIQEFYKNDLSLAYRWKFEDNSLRLSNATGGVDLMQFDTDGTPSLYKNTLFMEGSTHRPSGSGEVQTIQKGDGSVVYTLRYSGNSLVFRYATGGVDAWTIGTDGRVDYLIPPAVPVKTVATLPAVTPAGQRAMVSDSSVAASGNFGAVVATGGANVVPVYSDGANWRIG